MSSVYKRDTEVSSDGSEMGYKGEERVRVYERTYRDGDGVVPSKVMPDVVILQVLHRVAPARRTTR